MLKYGIRFCASKSTLKWGFLLLYIVLIVCAVFTRYSLRYPFQLWHVSAQSEQNFNQYEEENVNLEVYNISQMIKADFKCIKTRTVPSTTVCLYSQWHDKYISHDLEDTGRWEPQVAEDFLEVLLRDQSVGVFDIGANIGYYTMLAAKMGHQVVAVEPFVESIRRIHQAVQLENLSKLVTVLRNAVADVRTSGTVLTSGDNQGDTRIELGVQPCQGACPPTVKTILLDDLVDVSSFKTAVMKLDIQGYEHKAFQHASVLFSRIKITYIFMEWLVMKEYFTLSENQLSEKKSTDSHLVEELLSFFFHRNYRPYSLSSDGGHSLDPIKWPYWPNDMVWHLLADSDVKSKLLQTHFYQWPP